MRGSVESRPGAGAAQRTGVVAAHASFFILEQFFEVLDQADGDDYHRSSHAEEEERHNYFCHETNDKIHRAVIVPPIGAGGGTAGGERRW